MSRKLRAPASEPCPKCKSDLNIKPKLLMLRENSTIEGGWGHHRNLELQCNHQVLLSPPLERFVTGFYCDRCGIGYIPDSYLLPGSYLAGVARQNKQKLYFADNKFSDNPDVSKSSGSVDLYIQ
jgi:hypothetical protein